MTLNIDKEYPGDVEFDYETIARQVVESVKPTQSCYGSRMALKMVEDARIYSSMG